MNLRWFAWLSLVVTTACSSPPPYDRSQLSFFVTSKAAGSGGNIGGLAGADAHCQSLAAAVGSQRTWRAYLSASDNGQPVHAKDRIGTGPWINANGVLVAKSIDDLHGSPGPPQEALSYHENGRRVGMPHDIMTGSNQDGTLAEGDFTCRNWRSTAGKTWLGHSNRIGSCCGNRNTSWNSAHESQGCSSSGLASMGGASYFYCFATN